MTVSVAGVRWPDVPLVGAVGAGRHDPSPAVPEGYTLTPSGQGEQDNARLAAELVAEEAAGAGPECPG